MSARAQPPPARPRWRRDLTVRMPCEDVAMSLAAPPSSSSSSIDTTVESPLAEMELVCLVDSGEGGKVWLVRHRDTRREYALKVLYERWAGGGGADTDDAILRAADDDDHPSLVRCHGGTRHRDNGELRIVLLEHMGGGSLSGRRVADERVLAGVARQALSGIAHLHRRGVVHGDIRPSNLFVDSSGRVKIAGFGADRAIDQINGGLCKASLRPAAYMSPDRADDGGYAGDIWSFGLTILELYTGSFPLEKNRDEQGQSIPLTCYSDDPPETPATSSPEFRSFVGCCLQMNPAKRPSAVQLMDHPFVTSN
uniref:Protein kinase domain-containing protein n=1 Tax=Oryza punctata TaxID=4537 RepID=A0A0E0L8U7_ORYPU